MSSSVTEPLPRTTPVSWRLWLGFGLLGAAFLYVLILPLLIPRGGFLWGHYRLKDIYLGIPLSLATPCAIAVLVAPRRFKRPLALRLTIICLSILATIFGFDAIYTARILSSPESGFWFDDGTFNRKYTAADSELGFVRKPNVAWSGYVPEVNKIVDYRADENGFRNDLGIKSADIVFIGDSFTEAGEIPQMETFARRVAAGSELSAVNLGRSGYGPQQELIVLRRYGLSYHPRVVVWELYEGNDLIDAQRFAEWRRDPQRRTVSLKDRYLINSLISEWFSRTRIADFSTSPRADLRHSDGTVKDFRLHEPYDPDQPDKIPEGWAETNQAIETGYRLCQAQDIKLIIVFVPTMIRVMEPYITFKQAADRAHYLPASVSGGTRNFGVRMAELCAKQGCSFIDSFTALRQAAEKDNRNLYIRNDVHLDLRGQEVLAQEILKHLRSQAIAHVINE